MATEYSPLLGLALPVTGELPDTWGEVVNSSVTRLAEDAIAGTAYVDVTLADWTLTTTGGGAPNEARKATLYVEGTPGEPRQIIAPALSKHYVVANNSDSVITVTHGAGLDGAEVPAGLTRMVAWADAQFVVVSGVDIGLGEDQVPSNADLGSAAYKDLGLGEDEIPTNADLGSAAYKDLGLGEDEIPTNADLGSAAYETVGEEEDEIPTNAMLGSAARATLVQEVGDGEDAVISQKVVSQLIADAIAKAVEDAAPPGVMEYYGGVSAPDGWLLCDGAAVSRTTYARLFAAIGTRFGSGNGTTTFNLPDPRGVFLRVWDNGKGIDSGRQLGSSQAQAIQQHTHTASTAGGGGHNHTASTGSAGNHSHSASTGTAGAHHHGNIISPELQFQDGGDRHFMATNNDTRRTTTDGDHTHTVSIAAAGNHTHTVSVSTVGNHTHTVTVNNTGGVETRPANIAANMIIKT